MKTLLTYSDLYYLRCLIHEMQGEQDDDIADLMGKLGRIESAVREGKRLVLVEIRESERITMLAKRPKE